MQIWILLDVAWILMQHWVLWQVLTLPSSQWALQVFPPPQCLVITGRSQQMPQVSHLAAPMLFVWTHPAEVALITSLVWRKEHLRTKYREENWLHCRNDYRSPLRYPPTHRYIPLLLLCILGVHHQCVMNNLGCVGSSRGYCQQIKAKQSPAFTCEDSFLFLFIQVQCP